EQGAMGDGQRVYCRRASQIAIAQMIKPTLSALIGRIVFLMMFSSPLTSIAGFARANSEQRSTPDQDPAFMGEAGPDVIANYQSAARQDLLQRNYDNLEKLASELRQSKARFPGGAWKIQKFYQGVSRPVNERKVSEQEWANYLPKVQKWVADCPKSITAHVALASAYKEYAWSARGTGFSDTVTEEGWHLYHERLMRARKILDDARQLPEQCPHWYATMETIAMG